MDIPLYVRVLWRFKFIVAFGFLSAIGLAFLSFVKVDPSRTPHFAYRSSEAWTAAASMLVTPHGFPWGGVGIPADADPARFAQLAQIYANLANSDRVKQLMLKAGPIDEQHEVIKANARPSANYSSAPPLPLIDIAAEATTAPRAIALVDRGVQAFLTFLRSEQSTNNIPAGKRVLVTVVRRPDQAQLLQGRSKTLPIVVFLTMCIATCGLAFMLENIRPRSAAEPAPIELARRSA